MAARLARQRVLSVERPALFTFYLHEFALRIPVGGSDVMSEQLHHLLRLSVRPHIEIRVVPARVGAHPAMSGDFIIMEFAQISPVVYLEHDTSSLFLESRKQTRSYQQVLSGLAAVALDEAGSRRMISEIATELYSHGEGSDEHRSGVLA